MPNEPVQATMLVIKMLSDLGVPYVIGGSLASAVQVLLADRFFPSTKRCSHCGQEQGVSLSEREYGCKACGQVIDRNLNAAINLKQLLYV